MALIKVKIMMTSLGNNSKSKFYLWLILITAAIFTVTFGIYVLAEKELRNVH